MMGESSSPSNTPAPHDRNRFPHVTYYDNVKFQHRLLTEALGVNEIALISSWSMGGTQAYQWAAQYPDMVKAIAPVACSAKTSVYNQLFLKSNLKAITADPDWNDGWYGEKPPWGSCGKSKLGLFPILTTLLMNHGIIYRFHFLVFAVVTQIIVWLPRYIINQIGELELVSTKLPTYRHQHSTTAFINIA